MFFVFHSTGRYLTAGALTCTLFFFFFLQGLLCSCASKSRIAGLFIRGLVAPQGDASDRNYSDADALVKRSARCWLWRTLCLVARQSGTKLFRQLQPAFFSLFFSTVRGTYSRLQSWLSAGTFESLTCNWSAKKVWPRAFGESSSVYLAGKKIYKRPKKNINMKNYLIHPQIKPHWALTETPLVFCNFLCAGVDESAQIFQ